MTELIEQLRDLYQLPLSREIGASSYLFPLLDGAHILFQAFVFGAIALLDLRLLGLVGVRRPVRQVADQVLPWTWAAFFGATVTGVLLFMAHSDKFVGNRSFNLKLVLMALAGVNMLVFHLGAYRSVGEWDLERRPPNAARLAGGLSLLLWTGVVFFGRYLWYPGN